MGVRFPSVFTNTFIGPLPANANETIALTTPPLTLPLDGAAVFIWWMFSLIAGTGVVSIVYKVRRGTTLTGTDITSGGITQAIAAGAGGMHTGVLVDTPGAVAGQQYTLTLSQSGATVASAVGQATLLAYAL